MNFVNHDRQDFFKYIFYQNEESKPVEIASVSRFIHEETRILDNAITSVLWIQNDNVYDLLPVYKREKNHMVVLFEHEPKKVIFDVNSHSKNALRKAIEMNFKKWFIARKTENGIDYILLYAKRGK